MHVAAKPPQSKSKHVRKQGTILSSDDQYKPSHFWLLKNIELQRVLQQGVKQGAVYLLWWEPGIGKSTVILQIVQDLILHNTIAIQYFTWEEHPNQINDRRKRLFNPETIQEKQISPQEKQKGYHTLDDSHTKQIKQTHDHKTRGHIQESPTNIQIFHATHIEDILSTAETTKPDLLIIDSIQTIYSDYIDASAGSPNQVKYCAEKLSEFAKIHNISIIIIGHVTKWWEIAGPKYLEHIVDVVLYLEGDRFGQLRFLRSQKNRFWHTDDSAIFEMTLFGLQPVYDMEDRIIKSASTMPGSVLSIGLDNGRPVITYIEVLLNKTKSKFPQRSCIGVDPKRVDLVIAILERYLKLNLWLFDIFVNIPGEFSFRDSGIDLAIAVAIYSQYTNQSPPKQAIFLAELALSGRLVKAKMQEKRSKEIPAWFVLYDNQNMQYITAIKNIFSLV
jgi:DNA repair protein RadA/Sms